METRAAVIAIIVKDNESAGEINALLHEYCDYVIGRMGIPYREKGINIISVRKNRKNTGCDSQDCIFPHRVTL